MEFLVPKFIEKEAKVLGPLTFKQSIYVGLSGVICFFLYFMYGKKNFALFIFLASIVVGIGLALAFVRVAGLSLPVTIVNFFKYSITPRLYFWKKKEVFKPTFYKLEESKKEKKYFKF